MLLDASRMGIDDVCEKSQVFSGALFLFFI